MGASIVYFHESGGWLVPGDHTKESAVAALNAATATPEDQEEYGVYPDDTWCEPFIADDFHTFTLGWVRKVPNAAYYRSGDDDEYAWMLHDAKPNSRGAFLAAQLYF